MVLPFNISRKIATRAIIVLVVVVAVYYGFRKFGSFLKANDRSDINLNVDEQNLTINENQAQVMADRLETAMDGAGTNSQTIIDTLATLETQDDFALLVKTYGRRENCEFFGLGCDTGNLIDWFEWEFYGFGNNWVVGGFPAVYWQEKLEAQLKRLGFSFDN